MSAFGLFALLLLAAVTAFALTNPAPVTLRFLVWQVQTTLALAVVGGAVIGGLLVLISSTVSQRGLRARLRQSEARVRDLEARQAAAGSPPAGHPPDHPA